MNFIKGLQAKVKENEATKAKVDAIISDLYAYMNLKKFHCGDELDGYINTQDVRNYLDQIRGTI